MDEPVSYGDSIQLNCHVTKGDKPYSLTWTVHGKEMSSGSGIETTRVGNDTSLLTVAFADFSSAGNYTCIASNAAGKTSYTAEILVDGIIKKFSLPPFLSISMFLFF